MAQLTYSDSTGKSDPIASLVDSLDTKLNLRLPTRKPIGGTWPVVAATSGTDTACSNGTVYVGRIFVPVNCTVTGLQYLVGSVGGTDKAIVTLYNENGTLLRASAAAGATVGTAAQTQQIAFALAGDAATAATTLEIEAGIYFVGVCFNGTTAKFRSVPAYCQTGANTIGNGLTQTFGTITTSITPPTTFTADKVPVASLY